jgi:hypothetical protein
MRTDQAKRLSRLAGKNIGHTIYVDHTIAYHNNYDAPHHAVNYRVTYFTSNDDCEGVNFQTWTEAEAFLRQLALKGVPDV